MQNKENRIRKRVQNLVDRLSEFESKQSATVNKHDEVLKKKNIFLKSPFARIRCGNCISFNNNTCMSYRVEVSENHGCPRFYTFRTFHGGGFSPK